MSNINTVAVSGNATRDPEFKQISDDFAVAKLGIAVSRQKKVDGEYTDVVSFFDVEVLGNFANLVAKKIKKGDPMAIKGRLEQQRWESAEGNRSKVVIIAEEIDSEAFFRNKDEDNALGDDQPAATAPADAPAATPEPAAPSQDDDIPF